MAEVEEAQEILEALGMPSAQHNRMSGMTLIALCELTPDAPWSAAKKGPCTVTKGIMDHLREHYGTEYAPNTRETFRRQVLHQFVQGRIAVCSPVRSRRAPALPWRHGQEDEEGKVAGLISCFEALRQCAPAPEAAAEPVPVSAVMQPDPVTIAPEATVSDAVARMRQQKSDYLLVVKEERLVGIVTESDILQLTARLLEQLAGEPAAHGG